jgi:SAM-dependent MidA family methyltransferase
MEQALYHPQHGYYANDRCSVGREGDYFTNVSVGPVFGRLLARQFVEMWEKLGRPVEFTIVEQGAHHGEFARDVLETLHDEVLGLGTRLRYRIVEPFPVLQERQAITLQEFRDHVDWKQSYEDLESFTGIYFCNELLDALPVHLLVAVAGQWQEKFVTLAQENLIFINRPIANGPLQRHLERIPLRSDGYETETNMALLELAGQVSQKLQRGYWLAIDYGFTREQFYDEERVTGTLQCRARHQVLASPFAAIGEADITAHIDWTSLVEQAEATHLHVAGFTDQHHFLTGLLSEWPAFAESTSSKERRALQTLLHPEMLGRSFQVLALARAVNPAESLSGFKFAKDARRALGL